ncbi:YTH domain-containing protein 2 [Clonorchis sinensis]|uniref:YTH domain-containing protein 2 n=1 Tax=Clonorchis sinensis TaxID=79923 RepID=A0A8T1MXX6_CLOSI|nr:YTH domain-containing protein 2 [Clonorchis sinensis]
MSHIPQNVYGNMTNAADTYYGTLFSHLSYGMGENGGTPNPGNNPDAAALAAAMAAVAGGGGTAAADWSGVNSVVYPQTSGATLLSGVNQHHHQTNSLGDMTHSGGGGGPVSSSGVTTLHCHTFGCHCCRCSAAYPAAMHPQQLSSHPNATATAVGRSFMPTNTGQTDYTQVYYRSPPRQPGVRTPLTTGLYSSEAQFPTATVTLPGWPYSAPSPYHTSSAPIGGIVPISDGWSTPTSQQMHPVVCSELDSASLHHLVGSNTFAPNQLDDRAPKDPVLINTHPYYTSHLRDQTVNYGTTHGGNVEDPSISSYPTHGTGHNPITSHLVNGMLSNGQAVSYADAFLSSMRPAAQPQHFKPPPDDSQNLQEGKHMLDEFNRLSIREYSPVEGTTATSPPPATTSQSPCTGDNKPKNPSATWSSSTYSEVNQTVTARPGMGSSPRTGGPVLPVIPNSVSLNSTGRPIVQPPSSVAGEAPRAKTWANIAGQPPRGSAAVLVGSTTGWSAKRLPGSMLVPAGSRPSSQPSTTTPLVIASAPTKASTANGEQNPTSFRSSASAADESTAVVNKAGGSCGGSVSYDESMRMFQRESEALYQRLAKSINPATFDTSVEKARFFVIKSFSEDDIHRSIKYSVWCSTELGNKKLDSAYVGANNQYPIYLFFSVNGSGHFCGMAEMTSRVDYDTRVRVWAQDKWQGAFSVRWIFVKDVPNTALRHIRIESNENKPVTHSRDATELPLERGRQVMEVFANYSHTLSIFDDFLFYEQRERQDGYRRKDTGTRRG